MCAIQVTELAPGKYIGSTTAKVLILWHVEPLLGSDHEISNYTTVVARYRFRKQARFHGNKRKPIMEETFLCGPCRSVISSNGSEGVTRAVRVSEPSAWGYNWATLFLGDINTGIWPSREGESNMTQ
jgi:hypothetical protein